MSCHLWSPHSSLSLALLPVVLGQLLSCYPGEERPDGSVWEVMWVDLVKGNELLSSGNTRRVANKVIKNVQLPMGHSDLLPGEATHMLLRATTQRQQKSDTSHTPTLLAGSRASCISAHLILTQVCPLSPPVPRFPPTRGILHT